MGYFYTNYFFWPIICSYSTNSLSSALFVWLQNPIDVQQYFKALLNKTLKNIKFVHFSLEKGFSILF
jgi:hypothetical protein